MAFEIQYTSAPKGLRQGSQGFCTVKASANIPQVLLQKLESLSVYRQVFPANHDLALRNPVVYSHLLLSVSGTKYHVLSRICYAGLDYSQRTNYFAHHVALTDQELVDGGPAWLSSQANFFSEQWDGEIGTIPQRSIPQGSDNASICQSWNQVTGDAGWGGAAALYATNEMAKPTFLIVELGTELLPLLRESLALLPANRRWNVSYSTYYTKLPPDISCSIRGAIEGSPEASNARKSLTVNTLVLKALKSQPLPNSPLVEIARTGNSRQTPRASNVHPADKRKFDLGNESGMTDSYTLANELATGNGQSLTTGAQPAIPDQFSKEQSGRSPRRKSHALLWTAVIFSILLGLACIGGAGYLVWRTVHGEGQASLAVGDKQNQDEVENGKPSAKSRARGENAPQNSTVEKRQPKDAKAAPPQLKNPESAKKLKNNESRNGENSTQGKNEPPSKKVDHPPTEAKEQNNNEINSEPFVKSQTLLTPVLPTSRCDIAVEPKNLSAFDKAKPELVATSQFEPPLSRIPIPAIFFTLDGPAATNHEIITKNRKFTIARKQNSRLSITNVSVPLIDFYFNDAGRLIAEWREGRLDSQLNQPWKTQDLNDLRRSRVLLSNKTDSPFAQANRILILGKAGENAKKSVGVPAGDLSFDPHAVLCGSVLLEKGHYHSTQLCGDLGR